MVNKWNRSKLIFTYSTRSARGSDILDLTQTRAIQQWAQSSLRLARYNRSQVNSFQRRSRPAVTDRSSNLTCLADPLWTDAVRNADRMKLFGARAPPVESIVEFRVPDGSWSSNGDYQNCRYLCMMGHALPGRQGSGGDLGWISTLAEGVH
jgi:hypothetical protein